MDERGITLGVCTNTVVETSGKRQTYIRSYPKPNDIKPDNVKLTILNLAMLNLVYFDVVLFSSIAMSICVVIVTDILIIYINTTKRSLKSLCQHTLN